MGYWVCISAGYHFTRQCQSIWVVSTKAVLQIAITDSLCYSNIFQWQTLEYKLTWLKLSSCDWELSKSILLAMYSCGLLLVITYLLFSATVIDITTGKYKLPCLQLFSYSHPADGCSFTIILDHSSKSSKYLATFCSIVFV